VGACALTKSNGRGPDRGSLGAVEPRNFHPRRLVGGIERDRKVLEEPVSSQDAREREIVIESGIYLDNVAGNFKFDVVIVNGALGSGDNTRQHTFLSVLNL